MLIAPKAVVDQDTELAGFIAALSIHAGISLGSIMALGLQQ